MYTYPAAGTGLDACLPPWTEDGGYQLFDFLDASLSVRQR